MKKIITTMLIGLLIVACGQQDSKGEEIGSEEVTAAINMDSIRRVYNELMKLRLDPLPLKQVPEKGKLNPVDEAPKDTLFFVFRENLRQILQEKNVFGLLEAVDEQIKNGFGDNNGFAEFVSLWGLDKPDEAGNSEVWQVLGDVLELGGSFSDQGRFFTANYVSSDWPSDYEPFEYGAIIGSGVRFRSAPTLQSQTIASISYNIVKVIEYSDKKETVGGESHPWIKVKLLDEREGFVYGKFLGSPVAYRAGFEQKPNGQWQMSFLLSGD